MQIVSELNKKLYPIISKALFEDSEFLAKWFNRKLMNRYKLFHHIYVEEKSILRSLIAECATSYQVQVSNQINTAFRKLQILRFPS